MCVHQDGYMEVVHLTDAERAVLPAIILARVAQSLAMAAYSVQQVRVGAATPALRVLPQDPGNAEYVLCSQAYNRVLLRALSSAESLQLASAMLFRSTHH